MSEREGFRSTADLSDEHRQELRRLAQAEPDTFWCEPCVYHDERVKATRAVGMDNTPVCDWHSSHSWQSPRPNVDELQQQIKELSRVYNEAIIPQWRQKLTDAEEQVASLSTRLVQAEAAVSTVIDEQGTQELHDFIDTLEQALLTVVTQLHQAVKHAPTEVSDNEPFLVAYHAAREALYRTPPPESAVSGKVRRVHPSMGNAPVDPEDYIDTGELEARAAVVERALKEPYEIRGDGGIDRATVARAQEALAAMRNVVIIDGVTYQCCGPCAQGEHVNCNRLTQCECPEWPFHRGHPSVKEGKGEGATRGYQVEYPSRPDKDNEPIEPEEWDDESVFADWPNDVPDQTASGHNRVWEWGRRVTEYLGLRDE